MNQIAPHPASREIFSKIFFIDIDNNLKCICKSKGTGIAKTIFKKSNILGGISVFDFKMCFISYNTQDCGIGGGINTKTSGKEQRTQK